MKKATFLSLFTLFFIAIISFSGCSKSEDDSYVQCSESEKLIDGSCVIQEEPSMATPVATPMEREFTDSVDVTLISPEGGYIFYSIDGSDWVAYTGSIRLTDSATIYAYVDSDSSGVSSIYSEMAMFSYSKVEDNSGDAIVDPNNARWVLSDTIIYTEPTSTNICYQSSINLTSGSLSSSISSASPAECNWDQIETISFTGSWTPPPSILIPGESYPLSIDISRSNPITEFNADNYIGFAMDQYDIECGFATANKTVIDDGSTKVFSNATDPSSASWSGSFEAPPYGYAGSTESFKFQLKANVRGGCVRYIYEWK